MSDIAKELRMGNIHYSEEFSHPRLGISDVKVDGRSYAMITSYGIHMVAIGSMKFEPIPISEEWLKHLGFVPVFDDIWCASTNDTSFDVVHCILNINRPETLGWYLCMEERPFYKKIEYVHQLQNIYFFLTRKELTTTK